MDKITLTATAREAGKAAERLRREGFVPAVIYGHGVTPKNVAVSALDFSRVYKNAGENSIVEITLEGKKVNVLIHDTQFDSLSGKPQHTDFFQVRMDEMVEAEIPVEYVGESPVVREQGGILVKLLEAIEVSALPADLPHSIEIDLSLLKAFDDHIKVSDVVLSDKVKVLSEPETLIVSIEAPRTQADLEALDVKAEADVTKVESATKDMAVPIEEEKK